MTSNYGDRELLTEKVGFQRNYVKLWYICISLTTLACTTSVRRSLPRNARDTQVSLVLLQPLITPIVRTNTISNTTYFHSQFKQEVLVKSKKWSKMKSKLIVPRGEGSPLETLRNRTAGRLRTAESRKMCRTRLCIPGLARHFFVILPSYVFQPFWVRSLLTLPHMSNTKRT